MCLRIDLFLLVFFQPVLGNIVVLCLQIMFVMLSGKTYACRLGRIAPLGHDYAPVSFHGGVSIPFALAKYMRGEVPLQKLGENRKRVLLLFVFGAIVQGNLLDFDLNRLSLIAIHYNLSRQDIYSAS